MPMLPLICCKHIMCVKCELHLQLVKNTVAVIKGNTIEFDAIQLLCITIKSHHRGWLIL